MNFNMMRCRTCGHEWRHKSNLESCPKCGPGTGREVYNSEEEVRLSTVPTVVESMQRLIDIRRAKAQEYGDNYKEVGKVMMALFPQGFVVQTAEEANRIHFIVMLAVKLSRYCVNLKAGGHLDSLDDMAVYAMLCKECDELAAVSK